MSSRRQASNDNFSAAESAADVGLEAGLNVLYEGIGGSGESFYQRGRRYARAMTAAHYAAATGHAAQGEAYRAIADTLLAPLGDASGDDLRDFVAGAYREDEDRVFYLLEHPDSSEPSTSSFGPGASAAVSAFTAMGRITSLMVHPNRRTKSAAVTRLIADQVKEVSGLMPMLPPTYYMAMLQGLGASWPDLDTVE
ncbi:hypothetical protein CFH99_24435 [Nocardioides aromaticivorans]|uniref:Uncharacterized protein n=1 Tax=Nocardioides aromaticivorans TaxID=200618 RepID=A0ABX7PRY1_9ACTN|nr:hypothetical protein CFH99_24435 [Nocardioides aromaticivorans]